MQLPKSNDLPKSGFAISGNSPRCSPPPRRLTDGLDCSTNCIRKLEEALRRQSIRTHDGLRLNARIPRVWDLAAVLDDVAQFITHNIVLQPAQTTILCVRVAST